MLTLMLHWPLCRRHFFSGFSGMLPPASRHQSRPPMPFPSVLPASRRPVKDTGFSKRWNIIRFVLSKRRRDSKVVMDRERRRDWKSCVCVCVCERERERFNKKLCCVLYDVIACLCLFIRQLL